MATEPITPKLAQAPAKEVPVGKTLDAAAYAKEIRERRGDIRTMESRLGLNATPPEGWEWRWFNDVGDRVPLALEDGWRFVDAKLVNMSQSLGRGNDDLGESQVRKTTTLGATPIQMVLMEIPKELIDEIRDVRALAPVRKFEETINRGGAAGLGSAPHIYNPGDNPQSAFHGVRNHIGQAAA